MEEKKRTGKGIKLNASQLPLTNKADFVIGKDSRKVLDNKIIENLNHGNHGYFPSSLNSEYKSWSVSRELEIPNLPPNAEAQMRMIEGSSDAEPLQTYESTYAPGTQTQADPDPFFMRGGDDRADRADDSNPFAHEPQHSYQFGEAQQAEHQHTPQHANSMRETIKTTPVPGPEDQALNAQLSDTVRETIQPDSLRTDQFPQADADAPSPWGAPTGDKQERFIVKQTAQSQQEETESPWAGPDMQAVQQPKTLSQADVQQTPQSKRASDENDLLPAWMNALVFDATISSELAHSSEEAQSDSDEPASNVELEQFLSSIPNEEFSIDNETMRHLFSSLCEPKTNSMKIKSPASDAADLAIAAAAAEILKSEVSIDEISLEDLSTEEMREAEKQPGFTPAESEAAAAAELEAIQKAYAMLDLTPLPNSQRKDSFKNVYDAVAKASDAQTSITGEQGHVTRTERGTIEMAVHAGGRELIPTYNKIGMLMSVAMSDGMSFVLSEERNTWHMIEQSGKVMVSGIQSVWFDKFGNLSYVTKRGDTVTLKVDGSIDTKFAKKTQAGSAQLEQTVSSQSKQVVPVQAERTVPPQPEQTPDMQSEPTPAKKVSKLEVAEKAQPKSDSKSKSKSDSRSKSDSKSESKPEPKSQSKPEPKSQSESEPKSQAKPEPKSQSKPDKKAQAKSDKSEAKSSKPSTKASSKPKKKGR